jgi:hypothetical protein
MINPKNEDDKDFLDFINSSDTTSPPEHLNKKILNFIKHDLNPTHKIVFSKLLAIQAFIGTLTLIFCPQFNLSLTNNYELFHYFHHKFGENICMAICGSIFIGTGAMFATSLLKSSEINKIKESRFLYYTSISIFALSIFFLLGSEIYLILAAYWLLGSTAGGLIVFEASRFIRKDIFHY